MPVFAIASSAVGGISTLTDAELLDETGSVVGLETVPVLRNVVLSAVIVAVIVIVAVENGGIAPSEHDTDASQVPWLVVTDTPEYADAPNRSPTVTALAVDDPELVATSVYVTVFPL